MSRTNTLAYFDEKKLYNIFPYDDSPRWDCSKNRLLLLKNHQLSEVKPGKDF
jgi:hypothetical protein